MAVIIDTKLLASKIIEIKQTVVQLEQKFNEVTITYNSLTKDIWDSPTKTRLDDKYKKFQNNYIVIIKKLNSNIEFLNNVVLNYEHKENMIFNSTDNL